MQLGWFFLFFAVSGFCSLVYEVVWLRLAMASFGVNTPLVSLFLSVFMAGLGLGSWGLGRFLHWKNISARRSLQFYALAELTIAAGGLSVPALFSWGHGWLNNTASAAPWGSFSYYFFSGLCVSAAILPWSAAMGATIPLAMAAIRRYFPDESEQSFSYLYVANLLGATLGTVCSAFILIELFGFKKTGLMMAGLNASIALSAAGLSRRLRAGIAEALVDDNVNETNSDSEQKGSGYLLACLFMTGCLSMILEVVWTRQFMPYIGLHVYSFAFILFLYLLANNLGAAVYRDKTNRPPDMALLWLAVAVLSLLAILATDPRLLHGTSPGVNALRLSVAIIPFCVACGFLTPLLIDRFSQGDPRKAGTAYAVNILGCIAGPLLGGFLLLPYMSEQKAVALTAVCFGAFGLPWLKIKGGKAGQGLARAYAAAAVFAAALGWLSKDFLALSKPEIILRDATASVAVIYRPSGKHLLVNGVGVTTLTPVTKWMAHLPLAYLSHPPSNALVICFGMGTTFRSLLSWQISATAVELVPSVPRVFGYYHPDAAEVLKSPSAHVVIDDGRRFLERTREQFDVITLDPAPPVEAAGTSLLYSRQFYALAKKRLKPDGILQQWHWREKVDPALLAALARALTESFPYVKVYRVGPSGFHFLASSSPLPRRSGRELAARLPAAAARDFGEWNPPEMTAEKQLDWIVSNEINIDSLLANLPPASALSDDQPTNEYYLLRALFGRR